MPKKCQSEGCTRNVFSNHYCQMHQNQRTDSKYLNRLALQKHITKSQKRIKPFSDKHLEKLAEYKRRRNIFLIDNPICVANVEGCTKEATQIHHALGRIGDLLTDVKHFKAVCHNCHVIIENEPMRAKELGLSGTRFIIK